MGDLALQRCFIFYCMGNVWCHIVAEDSMVARRAHIAHQHHPPSPPLTHSTTKRNTNTMRMQWCGPRARGEGRGCTCEIDQCGNKIDVTGGSRWSEVYFQSRKEDDTSSDGMNFHPNALSSPLIRSSLRIAFRPKFVIYFNNLHSYTASYFIYSIFIFILFSI